MSSKGRWGLKGCLKEREEELKESLSKWVWCGGTYSNSFRTRSNIKTFLTSSFLTLPFSFRVRVPFRAAKDRDWRRRKPHPLGAGVEETTRNGEEADLMRLENPAVDNSSFRVGHILGSGCSGVRMVLNSVLNI